MIIAVQRNSFWSWIIYTQQIVDSLLFNFIETTLHSLYATVIHYTGFGIHLCNEAMVQTNYVRTLF